MNIGILLLALVVTGDAALIDGYDSDLEYLANLYRGPSKSAVHAQTQFILTEYLELSRQRAGQCFEANPELREKVVNALLHSIVREEHRRDNELQLQILFRVCSDLGDIVNKIVALGDRIAIRQLVQLFRSA